MSGEPCAVVVQGEAGVGKTWLVRQVCEGLGGDVQVLWGACVHFGQATVPFAPVIGALNAWLMHADATTRQEVLAGADELGSLSPALGNSRSDDPGRLLPLLDLVFNRIAQVAPTVLVLDDLQWADRTSLDVLAYLISGFGGQRLALLATCRDEHRDEGNPLHGWLADMRRTPAFTEVHLDRLDLAATEAQIAGLLGHAVDIELAARVHDRSSGNPYLTELLIRDMAGRGRLESEWVVPAATPTALGEALLSNWHGLSAAARQITRVLAAAGRPIEFGILTDVLAARGVEIADLSGYVREARDQGVVSPEDDGRLWFRHPLLAEVLESAMAPDEAARVHATYAEVLGSRLGDNPQRAAADLAVHNAFAGRTDESYRWSLAAADYAQSLHAPAEEATNLERACTLWDKSSPNVRGSITSRIDLLFRASQACDRAGRVNAAIDCLDQAVRLVNPERDPLLASTLLCSMRELKWQQAAPGNAVLPESVQAVQLTQRFPHSPQRARALAGLADAEKWDDLLPDAAMHADEAVQIARKSGSKATLAGTLNARASVRLHRDEVEASMADAEEADRLARSCGDSAQQAAAANWRVICLSELGSTTEATTAALDGFDAAVRNGSPHWGYFLAALAAEGLLHSGRWQECQDLLRDALSRHRGPIPAAGLRMVAARLAVRSGNLTAARQHLGRALELIPGDYPGLRMRMALAGAEVFVASGQPLQALEWVTSRITHHDRTATGTGNLRAVKYNDQLLLPLANAAAELAVARRDAGATPDVARAESVLADMIARWPHEPFAATRATTTQAMRRALFAAEVARCKNDPSQAERWQSAIEKCDAAGAPWNTAVAQLRRANALLAAGTTSPDVADLLRGAHRQAVALGAQPLLREVDALARMARVTLLEPAKATDSTPTPPALASLTAREREILSFLVAGRSNGEIAKDLVISDKTVSVHVSNILRKTGTSTRVEAAALAERLTGHPES
ncbi:regulatory LuxR family protein [Kribbella pratensis]|uniref:Regulatory LuxR family protein n=1 Tax=Kribbella pratensis TaxID=2512112 RepID=A0A4V3GH69_9ACTN|nr:regulatory LuxR family protein [Kribbella pratensis]